MDYQNMKNNQTFSQWCKTFTHYGIGGLLDENQMPMEEYIPTLRSLYLGLDRFIQAQDKYNIYQQALNEIKNGKKVSHWIWFIFPQMRGLGKSEMSKFYGIDGRDEAKEYINHPVLRERLIEVTEAVYNNKNTVYEIFGDDAIKVRSCMLLFASVSDIPIFKSMIKKYCWN
jgi:uncharacterized protein (DUF1810 family)